MSWSSSTDRGSRELPGRAHRRSPDEIDERLPWRPRREDDAMARRHPRHASRPERPWGRLGPLAIGGLVALLAGCSGESATHPGVYAVGGPNLSLASSLRPFDECPGVLSWFRDEALARVGPYGLPTSDRPIPAGETTTAVPEFEPAGPRRRADGEASGSSGAGPAASESSDSSSSPPAPPAGLSQSSGAGSSPAGPSFSGTNVQEAGVDEPDVVKTDGRRLFSTARGELRTVDLTGQSPSVAARLSLPGGHHGQDQRMLLQGDRLLVLGADPDVKTTAEDGGGRTYRPPRAATRLTLVDVADVARPTVVRSVVVDGRYVDARLVGGRARVIVTSPPRALPFVRPTDGSERAEEIARKANEDVVRSATLEDWLPRHRPGDAPGDPGTQLVPCDQLARPQEFAGFDTLSVLALDLGRDSLDLADTVGLVAGGDVAYASDRSLYVATSTIVGGQPDKPTSAPAEPATDQGTSPPADSPAPVAPPRTRMPRPEQLTVRTAVHAFGITEPGPATYRASGFVEGSINDRWSLSEHAGNLRVVSTTGAATCRGCPGRQSQVSVLTLRDGELQVIGTAGDMGKGEMVKAVRFTGDRGYVVTFRQVDPFYVLDLSDPTRPRVAGELKIPGYSAYLHPLGDGRVLGVGQDANEQGRVSGVKVALYDVSDPSRPREVSQRVLPGTGTEVEQDARAFLWWAPTRLAVVPVFSSARTRSRSEWGAAGFRVDDAVTEVGRVELERPTGATGTHIRPVVVGDRLLTVTGTGMRVSDLATLADRGWVAL
jgi:hypothetical protein